MGLRGLHTHIYTAQNVMLPQQDYASKPVSSICGWLLIPSKDVCSGQLHSELLILHVNILVYSVGEAIIKSVPV